MQHSHFLFFTVLFLRIYLVIKKKFDGNLKFVLLLLRVDWLLSNIYNRIHGGDLVLNMESAHNFR